MPNRSVSRPFTMFRSQRRSKVSERIQAHYGSKRAGGTATVASAALLSLVLHNGAKANAQAVYGSPRKQAKPSGGYLLARNDSVTTAAPGAAAELELDALTLTRGMATRASSVTGLGQAKGACTDIVTSAADAGAGTLREAITNGNSNGGAETVCFDASLNGQTVTLASEITVSGMAGDALTIDGGQMITLSGGNTNRVLRATDGLPALTLYGLTITNGYSSDDYNGGGAVFVGDGTNLVISNSTFENNATYSDLSGQVNPPAKANGAGKGAGNDKGYFYYYGPCYRYYTGAYRYYCYGGGPRRVAVAAGGAVAQGSDGSLTVTDSTFSNNSVNIPSYYYNYIKGGGQIRTALGGAVFSASGGSITGSTFTNNFSSEDGAALGVTGASLYGYYYNKADDAGGPLGYRPIPPLSLSISNSTFTGNNSYEDDGGALFLESGGGSITLTNSIFTNNSSDGDGGGAAVRMRSPTVVKGGNSITVTGGSFTGNTSGSDGGGLAIDAEGTGVSVTVSNVTFSNNAASSDGGGLYVDMRGQGSALTITGGMFTGNYAGSDGGGASIEQFYGGASITGATFSGNTADSDAGGLFLYADDATVTLSNLTVTGNYSANDGGGMTLYVVDSIATLSDSTIANNESSDEGGGLYLYAENSTVTISNTMITGNQSNYSDGGGIFAYLYDSTLNINQSSILDNSAAYYGGGMSVETESSSTIYGYVNINDSTIARNTATFGGGLFLGRGTEVTLNQSTVSTNAATDGGGGIFAYAYLSAFYSTVVNNTAGVDGAGISVYTSNVTNLTNSIVSDNTGGSDMYGPADATYSLIQSYNGPVTDQGGSVFGQSAGLGPLANNGGPTLTHVPLAGSPAVGAGSTAGPNSFANDQRGAGFPRLTNGVPDMGSTNSGLVVGPSGPPAGPPVAVPTMTSVGAWVMSLALGLAGWLRLRRRPERDRHIDK